MNGTARPVILSLALLVLASGCATLRPSQSPTASTPPSTASAPTTPAPRTVAVPGPVSATDPARARLDEGRALIARGEVAAAAVALREALRLRPDLAEPRAQYFAGAAYATGAGVERDLVAAITWWTRAAEQGVAQADESLVQLRQAASGRSRRTPAERQAVEQAFGEYRARLWKDYPGLTREGDEPLGAALLRQGRTGEAVAILIREAAALSEPAQRILETLYDQGIDGQLPAHDARILAYLKSAAAEGRSRPRPRR